MNNAPLNEAVLNYIGKDFARMHTPGHKGGELGFLSPITPFDITEIKGADSLFEPNGAIAQTEALFTKHYGTAATLLSAGGSTLCIQTMLRLVAKDGGKIIAGRTIHTSAVHACALLGLEINWCIPQIGRDFLPMPISPTQILDMIIQSEKSGDIICAVFLTSPDYFGKLCDIATIADICKEYGMPLLVDNAHGAHLNSFNMHPMQLGASMCCDSLHKSMPVLTGGALLHIADKAFVPHAKCAMAMFASTSPSYLIMLSMDMLLPDLLNTHVQQCLLHTSQRVSPLAQLAADCGFALPLTPAGEDPLRLSIGFWKKGMSKEDMDALLTLHKIEPEYLSEHYCVLLFASSSRDEDYIRVRQMLLSSQTCAPLPPSQEFLQPFTTPQCMSLRHAALAQSELLPVEYCFGKICAQVISHCPPGVPIAMYGEKLGDRELKILKTYGITHVNVVKYT